VEKEQNKMKKATILLAILALAFMTVPAFALNNIVLNPGFENSSHLQYWLDSVPGHNAFTTSSSGTDDFARSSSRTTESQMYQIIDASTSEGWIAGGSSETVNFSFQYRRPDSAIAEYGLYYSCDPTVPATFNLDAVNTSIWKAISVVNSEPGLPQTSGSDWGTVSVVDYKIDDCQPQWFVIAFEGQDHRQSSYPYTTYHADFDNVSLTTSCSPVVPVPPSVLLLGSGLLGLGALRFRNIFG
jgi:hypothetical protein